MYLMQLAKLYLRDICFKKCFIKILNNIAKNHSLRSHIHTQWRPPEAAAQWPGVPSHPGRGGSAAMGSRPPEVVVARPKPPLPPPEGERARAQGPRAAHRRAPHLNRQEPPAAAHPDRRQIQPWGARIRQGGGRIGPRRPAAVRNDMIVGRKEEGVGRVR